MMEYCDVCGKEVVIDERQKAKLWEYFDILFGENIC